MRTEKEIREKISILEKVTCENYEITEEDTILDTLKWVMGDMEFKDVLGSYALWIMSKEEIK